MVGAEGFEPPDAERGSNFCWSGRRDSNPLMQSVVQTFVGRGGGIRTPGCCAWFELSLVGAEGFEHPTLWSQNRLLDFG